MNDFIWWIQTISCKNEQQNENMSQNGQPEVVVISIQYVGKQLINYIFIGKTFHNSQVQEKHLSIKHKKLIIEKVKIFTGIRKNNVKVENLQMKQCALFRFKNHMTKSLGALFNKMSFWNVILLYATFHRVFMKVVLKPASFKQLICICNNKEFNSATYKSTSHGIQYTMAESQLLKFISLTANATLKKNNLMLSPPLVTWSTGTVTKNSQAKY